MAKDLENVDDIGGEVARSTATFFEDKHNREIVTQIQKAGLSISNPFAGGKGPLEGQKFVFTGSLERWTRDEAERLVESLGGQASSSVSSETDYVIAGPGGGSKLDDARDNETPIMDEEGFIELLDSRDAL
jgi:DNA ligase (NAD+)